MSRPAAEPALTDEQLQLAWRQLRKPHWPATLQQALAHAWYRPSILGVARNLSRQKAVSAQRPPALLAGAFVPPTPSAPRTAARPASAGPDALGAFPRRGRPSLPTLDRKRAAANDRDSDD